MCCSLDLFCFLIWLKIFACLHMIVFAFVVSFGDFLVSFLLLDNCFVLLNTRTCTVLYFLNNYLILNTCSNSYIVSLNTRFFISNVFFGLGSDVA